MAFYATIDELINSVETMEISYRNLHSNIYINKNNSIVKIPYNSLVRDYMPFFEQCVMIGKLNPEQRLLYHYKPKKLSYDLYGTTELWSALLELNGMYSVIDFKTDTLKIYEPTEFKKLLNEVMIMEGIIT